MRGLITPVSNRPFYPKKRIENTACPICNDRGLVFRPRGWQGIEKPKYTECCAGPPWHKPKEI